MLETMQNLVVLMEEDGGPWTSVGSEPWKTSYKTGNMILNRFCIDEDAAFELSEVNYLKKIPHKYQSNVYAKKRRTPYEARCVRESEYRREVKGKEYSFLRSYYILRNSILIKNC